MLLKLLSLLLLTLNTSRCSLVIDKAYQAGINLSAYCPKMQSCQEGAHTLCVHFDPKKKMGVNCINPQEITMTTTLAGLFVEVVNTIRSKVAYGKETGKDKVLLPRGYGIFRLQWDSELATFAQLMANQCIIRRDFCRATYKFRDPSQLASLSRFTYPDWASPNPKLKYPKGLKIEQQMEAVERSMMVWYIQKNFITKAMVESSPDFNDKKNIEHLGPLYLELVNGETTHMGCGMTGTSQYVYYRNKRQGMSNEIIVFCNFSAKIGKGKPVYKTKKPGKGFSAKCGCPQGSMEDGDCLCNLVETPVQPRLTCPVGETTNCDLASVLLPIVSFEDAPPEKLHQLSEKETLKDYVLQRKPATKPKARARTSQELMEFIREKGIEDVLSRPRANEQSSVDIPAPSLNKEQQSSPQFRLAPDLKPPPLPPPPPRRPPILRPSPPARPHPRPHPPPPRVEPYSTALPTHVKPRPAKPASRNRKSRPPPKLPPKNHQMKKKASNNTRVAHSQLPDRRSSSPFKVLKKDVKPRKDFSNINQNVNDYLKRHRNKSIDQSSYRIINGNNEQTQPTKDIKPYAEENATAEAVAIETGLNRAEETVMNFDQYLGEINSSNYNDTDVDIKDDYDNKLLYLLDTLEREVKHIALDGDEKQLLDAKIRKIYGTIAGKNALQMFPKPILFSTPDPEAAEIDFGETKSRDQFEPNQPKNERPQRRMHMKNRDSSGMRSEDQADQFHMPETA